MKSDLETRQKAIAWWNELDSKGKYFYKNIVVKFRKRLADTLTGREIELIWNTTQKNNPIPLPQSEEIDYAHLKGVLSNKLYKPVAYYSEQHIERLRNLMSNIAAFNQLTGIIVELLSESFDTDCKEICKIHGITYNLP